MTNLPGKGVISVDIVVYEGFKALEAIGPMSVFNYANHHLERLGLSGRYDVRVSAVHAGEIRSDTHMSLCATKTLDLGALPHTAIIVGAREIEDALAAAPEIVEWVRAASHQLVRTVALCSGAFFLAAAGLLDGKRATTHWALAPLLGTRHPAVIVDPDCIFVREDKLWTSAGVTAGIDLALALVEEDFGRNLALEVARDLVVYLKRPGGQSQFSVHLSSQQSQHPGIRGLQDWVFANLDKRISVADMAQFMVTSPRNFARVFQRETGMSPMVFVEQARVEAARRALEDGTLPIKTIAMQVGFRSYEPMRKAFLKWLNVSPQAYRSRFGSTLASHTPEEREERSSGVNG
ncbi:GlxA family transcriptional regulator [Paraburkholderia caffeinilytica]|uniref:GlxA family transcriptional regulator n=1 Tax=Paraburkholderia caffeinilytica TaxID=1761016 RepID=UPI0038BD8151